MLPGCAGHSLKLLRAKAQTRDEGTESKEGGERVMSRSPHEEGSAFVGSFSRLFFPVQTKNGTAMLRRFRSRKRMAVSQEQDGRGVRARRDLVVGQGEGARGQLRTERGGVAKFLGRTCGPAGASEKKTKRSTSCEQKKDIRKKDIALRHQLWLFLLVPVAVGG